MFDTRKDYRKEILLYLHKHTGSGYCNLKPLALSFGLSKHDLYNLLWSMQEIEKAIASDNNWTHYCIIVQNIPIIEDAEFNFSITASGRTTALGYLNDANGKINTKWVIIGAIAAILALLATVTDFKLKKFFETSHRQHQN